MLTNPLLLTLALSRCQHSDWTVWLLVDIHVYNQLLFVIFHLSPLAFESFEFMFTYQQARDWIEIYWFEYKLSCNITLVDKDILLALLLLQSSGLFIMSFVLQLLKNRIDLFNQLEELLLTVFKVVISLSYL